MNLIGILSNLAQLKVSFLGFNKNASRTLGKPTVSIKIAEVSVAILSFGIRVTLRI